jgi:YegS/Rv2252/BmrU family lipid kinase
VTRALIITNPAAARADEGRLLAARARLVAGGWAVEIGRTGRPGDGERLARAALADGVDVVIAHGGDGTTMDVAAALIGTERALGLLPAGTGNLLAGNLHIPRSWRAAIDVILAGSPRPIDMGLLTTAAGSRCFAVACGTGFDAELMRGTAPRHKRVFGMGAYVATAVGLSAGIRRTRVRIEADGVVHEAHAFIVLVANCGEIIPGILPIHAAIRPDDGVFDIAILDAASFASALRVMWRLFQRQPHADPGISFLRASRVAITTEPVLPVQADGEASGTTPLAVELLPRALHVLAPRRA